MISNVSNNKIFSLLANSSIVLPLSYGAWFSGGDEIFVSNKLKLLIGASENIIDPYHFVQLMQNIFGSFLNIAVEKVTLDTNTCNEYSSTMKSASGELLNLKLVFDSKKMFYILLIDKAKDKDNFKEKNDALTNIIDSIPLYIWQKDRDLRITYCNKKYSDALESTQSSVLANNLKLFSSSRKEGYIDQTLYSSKAKNFKEHTIIKGERRTLEVTEFPFIGNAPSIGFAIDITEEEDLRKEYDTYKQQTEETLDSVSIPIGIFDANMTLVFANSAICKLFDLEESYLLSGRSFTEIFDLVYEKEILLSIDDVQKYKEKAIRLFTEVIEPYHSVVHLQNGKTLNVNISPNYGGGLVFLFEDISDKIALEREINSFYAVQKETLDHLQEGILVFGTDNRIKMTNPIVNDMWNKAEKFDSTNTHIRKFFEESESLFVSKTELEVWISKLISVATQRVEFSDTIELSSGKTLDYTYIPLPDGLHLIKFFDATDKANLKKALKEKTDIVSQIDKLKTNIISSISYELSAPLNTIIGFGDILINQYFGELNSRQLEYCNGMIKSAEKLFDIVDAIINLASIEAGQMKLKYSEVNVHAFISNSISLFANRLHNQNISLNIEFEDQTFTACFDERAMGQVLFQMLSKAIKLTPSGGGVSVSVNTSDSDYFSITVLDTGIGLSDEELEKVRRKFVNEDSSSITDNSIEFGLLLANCIVRLHSGKMSIEHGEKSGTAIKFSIPIRPFLT